MLARSEQHEERQEPQEKASNSDAPSGNEDQAEPDQLARHGTPLIGETSDDASQACVIDESGLPADSDSDGSSESDSMPTVTDELHQATVTAAANALLHGSLIGSSSDDDDEEDEYEEGSSPSESSGYESGFSSDGAEAGSDYDLANGDVAAAQRHERRTSSLTLSTTSEEVVEQLQDSTQSSESEAESQAQSDFFDDDDKISSTPCGPTQHLSLSSPSPITHRGKPVVRDASLQCLPLVHIPQPPQKDRDLYDDTVDSPADDNFSDCDFDEDDLKDFYTDDSGDDMYAGFLPQEPVVQQQEPEPNRQRKRSLSPPDTVLRRVASTSHFRPPVIGPPTRPFDTVPHPQHQVFRAPGKLIHGLSPIRAGKLRATTPPKGRWQPSFSPCDYIRDLIVTELIHLAMTDWKIVPMAVEERHGMDPRGKINLYRFLLNIRRLLNLQLTSRAWRAAVCRNAMWLGALNIMMRTQLYRYPLDPQAALRLSRWPPFFSFVAWLRERCLACLLNGVNVDIRGINGGLSILYHSTSPDASFGPVSVSPAADMVVEELPRDEADPFLACLQSNADVRDALTDVRPG